MNLSSLSARLFTVYLITLLSMGLPLKVPSISFEQLAPLQATPIKGRLMKSNSYFKGGLSNSKLAINAQKLTKIVQQLEDVSNSQKFCGTECFPLFREYKDLMKAYSEIKDKHMRGQYGSSEEQINTAKNKHENMLTSVTLQISQRMANCQGARRKKKIKNQLQTNRQKDPVADEQRYFIKMHKIITEQKSIDKRIEQQRNQTEIDETQLNACFKDLQTLMRNIDAFIKDVKLKLPSFFRTIINGNILEKRKQEIEFSLMRLRGNIDRIQKNKKRIRREITRSEQALLDIMDKTEDLASLNRIQLQKLLKQVQGRTKQISQSLSNIDKSNLVALSLKNYFRQKNGDFLKTLETTRLQLQRRLTQKPQYDSLELAKQSPKDLFIAKKVECKSLNDYSQEFDQLYGSYQKLQRKIGSTLQEWIQCLLSLYKYEDRFLNFYFLEVKRMSKIERNYTSQLERISQIETKIDSLRDDLFQRLRQKQIATQVMNLIQKYIALDKQFDSFISKIYIRRPKPQEEKLVRAETVRLRKLFAEFKSETQAIVCQTQMCRILRTNEDKIAVKMSKTANFVLQLFSPKPEKASYESQSEQQFDRSVFNDPSKQFVSLKLLSLSDSPLKNKLTNKGKNK